MVRQQIFPSYTSVKDMYILLGYNFTQSGSVIILGRGKSIPLVVPAFWELLPPALGFVPFLCSEKDTGKLIRIGRLEEWGQRNKNCYIWYM